MTILKKKMGIAHWRKSILPKKKMVLEGVAVSRRGSVDIPPVRRKKTAKKSIAHRRQRRLIQLNPEIVCFLFQKLKISANILAIDPICIARILANIFSF